MNLPNLLDPTNTGALIEWALFLLLSAVAVATAAAMILTMSMYRAGLALMASFVALAGLFVLLDADLLAAIQVMMNVGGMLVMALFMVMLMIDPGGEMMWDMKKKMRLPGPGAFSMSMPRGENEREQSGAGQMEATEQPAQPLPSDWTCPMHLEVSAPGPGDCPICGMALVPRAELLGEQTPAQAAQSLHEAEAQSTEAEGQIYTCPMHPEVREQGPGSCPICGMDLVPASQEEPDAHDEHPGMQMEGGAGGHEHGMGGMGDMSETGHMADNVADMEGMGNMAGMNPAQHRQMMVGMAMSTAQLPWALVIGAASALALIALAALTPWPLSPTGPTQDATTAVGDLLLSRYMIGFEGSAFLILAGMAASVILASRDLAPRITEAAVVAAPQKAGQIYTCPMHPEVRENQPGQCPICGMDLVPTEEVAPTEAGGHEAMHGDHHV